MGSRGNGVDRFNANWAGDDLALAHESSGDCDGKARMDQSWYASAARNHLDNGPLSNRTTYFSFGLSIAWNLVQFAHSYMPRTQLGKCGCPNASNILLLGDDDQIADGDMPRTREHKQSRFRHIFHF